MTKSELIALLAADPAVIGNHLTARDVDDAVNSILNAMTARASARQPGLKSVALEAFRSITVRLAWAVIRRAEILSKFPPRSCLTSRPVKKCVNA